MYKNIYIYSLPPKPSQQHTVDVYENWNQLFSHRWQKGAVVMLYNEIIKMFWRWLLTILTALRFLAPVMCVLELSWEGPWEGPGVLEHQEDGSPSWPSPEGPQGWRSLKTNRCWEKLSAACDGWGNTPCPWGTRVCWSRSRPQTVWLLFLGAWFGKDGRMREERSRLACWCPLDHRGKLKYWALGKEESPYRAYLDFPRLQISVDYRCCSTARRSWPFQQQLCLVTSSYEVWGGREERRYSSINLFLEEYLPWPLANRSYIYIFFFPPLVPIINRHRVQSVWRHYQICSFAFCSKVGTLGCNNSASFWTGRGGKAGQKNSLFFFF